MKTIKCIVAAYNASGSPDFFFVKVRCSAQQYDNGKHYEAAQNAAEESGYEPKITFDENDDGYSVFGIHDGEGWPEVTVPDDLIFDEEIPF